MSQKEMDYSMSIQCNVGRCELCPVSTGVVDLEDSQGNVYCSHSCHERLEA